MMLLCSIPKVLAALTCILLIQEATAMQARKKAKTNHREDPTAAKKSSAELLDNAIAKFGSTDAIPAQSTTVHYEIPQIWTCDACGSIQNDIRTTRCTRCQCIRCLKDLVYMKVQFRPANFSDVVFYYSVTKQQIAYVGEERIFKMISRRLR